MKNFPLIEAYLVSPSQDWEGKIGICTNTTAPGQVLNEINTEFRDQVSVLGPLIVNRDGTERMIVNSLAHPNLKYLILYSEESSAFFPSTNLLSALLYGVKNNHKIKNAVGISTHYPNLTQEIIDKFKKNIQVLPLFISNYEKTNNIVEDYLSKLKPGVSSEIYNYLVKENKEDKIYYDSLNKLIGILQKYPSKDQKKSKIQPEHFQALQPPIINLEPKKSKPRLPFRVFRNGNKIQVELSLEGRIFYLKAENAFKAGYSLTKFLREKNSSGIGKHSTRKLGGMLANSTGSPFEQLMLGAEIGRVQTEIKNNLEYEPFIESSLPLNKKSSSKNNKEKILTQPSTNLIPDKEYYYQINIKNPLSCSALASPKHYAKASKNGKLIAVTCVSYQDCKYNFELRGKSLYSLIEKLAEKNCFQEYEMDILHRIDVGSEIAKATMALDLNCSFIQDFPYIIKENYEKLPFFVVEGNDFLSVHQKILSSIYTRGINEEHADAHKGLTRSGAVLAVYRNPAQALKSIPSIYRQGNLTPQEMRETYKAQLLRKDKDTAYNYGERTRSHFEVDQLTQTIDLLKKNPRRAAIIQRFDPVTDMSKYKDSKTGELKYTHDPCLTHDILFIKNNKLCSFHIARAHNIVNAYLENIFGLYDAYLSKIAEELGIEVGEMYMFSSRANILMLTEAQRAKKIITEPSKPPEETEKIAGPYELDKDAHTPQEPTGIAYFSENLKKVEHPPSLHQSYACLPADRRRRAESKIIQEVENFPRSAEALREGEEGINILEKSIQYLQERGEKHNNPVLTSYQPNRKNPQGNHMVFFQANAFRNKIYANMVFANRSLNNLQKDKELGDYLSTQYSKKLNIPLGEINIIYTAYSF